MKKLLCLIALGTGILSAQSIAGLWDAKIVASGDYEVPFRMEFSQTGTQVTGSFLDGDVKWTSTGGQLEDGSLHLWYNYYNTELVASLKDGKLEGNYIRHGKKGDTVMPFSAWRFAPSAAPATPAASIGGEWILNSDVKGRPNVWRFFVRQSGSEVTGSVLRLDGDTGTLSGKFEDGKLVMSHFSGARPSLLEATISASGEIEGTLNRKTHFTGVRKSEAIAKGLPMPVDPSRFTSVKDPSEPFQFGFPDLNGNLVSNTDERFRGKVVIVTIMGSWCPNCQDEAPFLVKLYKKYHSQGLEIVGLAFEGLDNPEKDKLQVERFINRHGITYPILMAGQVEPGAVPKALPQVANFDSYPTAFYLGRDGRVRSVHDGFASPATGEEHVRLTRETEELVKQLLAEKAPEQPTGAAAALR